MKKLVLCLTITCLLILVLLIFSIRKNNALKNKIETLDSRHRVELLVELDRVKSLNFAIYEKELQRKDSIYNQQIKLLQNENKRLSVHYTRLYNRYSGIVIERPEW